jgi:hypothetical protein
MKIVPANLENFEKYGVEGYITNYQSSRVNPKYFANRTYAICYATHYCFVSDCFMLLRAKFVHQFVCYSLMRPISMDGNLELEREAAKTLIDFGISLRLDEEECNYLGFNFNEMDKLPLDEFYVYDCKELAECVGEKYSDRRRYRNALRKLLEEGKIRKEVYSSGICELKNMPLDVYFRVLSFVEKEQTRISGKYEIKGLETVHDLLKIGVNNLYVSIFFSGDEVIVFHVIDIFG